MQEKIFELVVVGAGMVGSAAAFHATQLLNTSVCLVGPPEPKNRQDAELFGCWYDEGRLYYRLNFKHTWRVLAAKSVERHKSLEKLTNLKIYTEAGYLNVHMNKEKLKEQLNLSSKCKLEVEDISDTWKTIFPFLNLPEGASVCYEKTGCGHLSPRQQVRAHQQAALTAGAQILPEVVSTIQPSNSSTHRWEVKTECGTVLQCQHVLVAAGNYASFKPLFQYVKPNMAPQLELRTQTVAFLQICEEEALRLRMMPVMVVKYPFQNLDGAYILPPIKYPDGKWYLKLGHGRAYEEKRTTLADVREWYVQQSGVPECVNQLSLLIHHLLPGLKVEAVSGDGCLTSHTPNSEPYIDVIAEGFGVALGCNGYGAKSSDEMGRLAACLTLLGKWDSEIPRERVRVVWQNIRDH